MYVAKSFCTYVLHTIQYFCISNVDFLAITVLGTTIIGCELSSECIAVCVSIAGDGSW